MANINAFEVCNNEEETSSEEFVQQLLQQNWRGFIEPLEINLPKGKEWERRARAKEGLCLLSDSVGFT